MIMVASGDGGASLTARSERGAAGAALGGRGERAEKADSGAPQPHIEGTFLYVIACCAPGSGAIGDVARRAARGRGCGGDQKGRAVGIRGLGGDTMRRPLWVRAAGGVGVGGWERTPGACWDRKRLTSRRLSHLLGVAPGVAAPASCRAAQLKFPPLSRKGNVSRIGCLWPGEPPSLRGLRGQRCGLASRISASGPRLSPDLAGLTSGGSCHRPCGLSAGIRLSEPAVDLTGQLFWSWSPMTSSVRTNLLFLVYPWCFRVEQTQMRRYPLALLI